MSFWFEKHSAVYLLGRADDLCFVVRQPMEFPVRARMQRAIAVGRSCICMSVGLGSLVLAAACIIGVSRLRLHGEYLSGLVIALEGAAGDRTLFMFTFARPVCSYCNLWACWIQPDQSQISRQCGPSSAQICW